MTSLAQLREGALALPEVEEGNRFAMVAFSVQGKVFASVTQDGRSTPARCRRGRRP